MESLLNFTAATFASSLILFASSRIAWVKAPYKTLLFISFILALASLLPKVGFVVSSILFFYLTTSWLNANGMEAIYMWLIYIILMGGFALLALV